MKLSKNLLRAMLVAVTAGTIISCEKQNVDEGKKPVIQKFNPDTKTGVDPGCCPACGMG